ncbi:MAG: tetratricopeptide repeat protein [Candidatus Methylomirabilales bacterium]
MNDEIADLRMRKAMMMPKVPQSPMPRGRRIPLSRFWLDRRVNFFLGGVCLLVLVAALISLWPPPRATRSVAGSSPAMHRERAQYYEGIGQIEEAIRVYQAALHLSPGDPAPHMSLALLFERQGRFAEAVASYERYLELTSEAAESAAIRTRIEVLRRTR